jgi:hypothetical protein
MGVVGVPGGYFGHLLGDSLKDSEVLGAGKFAPGDVDGDDDVKVFLRGMDVLPAEDGDQLIRINPPAIALEVRASLTILRHYY